MKAKAETLFYRVSAYFFLIRSPDDIPNREILSQVTDYDCSIIK